MWMCPTCGVDDDAAIESRGDFRCQCGHLEIWGKPVRDLRRRPFNSNLELPTSNFQRRSCGDCGELRRDAAGLFCNQSGRSIKLMVKAGCPLGFFGHRRVLHFVSAHEKPRDSKRRTCWTVTESTTLAELQEAIADVAPTVVAARKELIDAGTWFRLENQNQYTRFLRLRGPAEITIGITTYKRPDSLARCLASARRYFPRLPVVVVDTKGNVSTGRNELVRRCKTPYLLLLEDDMELTAKTDLDAMLDVVKSDDEIAGCGGMLIEPKQSPTWAHDFREFRGEVIAELSRQPLRKTPLGTIYQPCDLIKNFGVFRVDALRETGWNEALPLSEHREFFWRLSKKWKVAIAHGVSLNHFGDRPNDEYNEQRARARELLTVAEEQIGLRLAPTMGRFQFPEHRPNIVMLGVGHANTTITTKQLAAIGWQLGDADEEFAESVAVRELNDNALRTGSLDVQAARAAIARMHAPWAVKDPRFARGTLPQWLAVFAPHKPLLLWVQKDLDRVMQSYETRGESPENVRSHAANCQRYFDGWPWAKLTLHAEDIAAAVTLFDTSRSAGAAHG
jgi:hypothetical protein